MYRKSADFVAEWTRSAEGTLAVFKAITDDKMNVSIVEGHNSLAWLAWHLAGAAAMFGNTVGLQIPAAAHDAPTPTSMADIVQQYEAVHQAFLQGAPALTDEQMEEAVDSFAGPMPRGAILRMMVDHQTHHRGQMTVLLRQAGLTVPPVLGPTKEMQ